MDALLPPLDTFAVVELTAPPELNENTVSSKEMATNAVEDVFLPTSSEGAAGDEGAKLPETESDVDLPIDESANDGLTVHQLQLKHNYDDLFEPQKNDNLELAVSVASPSLEDDAEIEVRESLDGLLNAVVSDVENHPGDHLTDGDEDAEQPTIKDCYIKLDKSEVARFLRNQRRRLKRIEERREAERLSQVNLQISTGKPSRTVTKKTPMPYLTRMVCKECHESFLELKAFRLHFRGKHPDNLDEFISVCGQIKQFITCPLCQSTFRAKVDFNSHMSNLHSISRWVFESFDCYDQYLLGDVVAEHLRKKAERNQPVEDQTGCCDVCFKIFATVRGVANHKSQTNCGVLSAAVSPSVQHSSVSNIQEKVAAPKVPERSTTRPKIAPQSATFAKPKPEPQAAPASTSSNNQNMSFVCEWCRDRLKTTAQLNTHLNSKHSVPANFTPEGCNLPDFFTALEHHFTVVEKEENSYECVSCKETFLEKVGLLEHFSGEHLKSKVVGMQIKLQCGICSHEDSDVRNLHDHMWNAHANQRLEDMVIRVGDVSRSHRCGEECKLLWKKPVNSVEAAPRTEGRKRPSSEVKAMPRSVKQKKLDTPLGLQVSEDDEEMMRQIEEEEEKALREQEVSFGNTESRRLEDKKEKKRLYNIQYKARIRALLDPANGENSSSSEFLEVKKPNDVKPKTTQCMLCLVQCEDINQHIQEKHSSSSPQGERRSARSRSKPQPVAEPVLEYAPPVPVRRPQTARRSGPAPSTQIMRCSSCMTIFGDIVSLMQHRIVCMSTATAPVARKKQPAPKAAPVVQETPAAVKTAQFVLMDEDEFQQDLHCKSCKIKYSTVGEWQAHIQEMHLNELSCELCPATFRDESSLSKHIIKSHKITYPCMVCNTDFTNKKIFLSHMLNVHQISKQIFMGITVQNVDHIKRLFEEVVIPSIMRRGNAVAVQPSTSSRRKPSHSRKHQSPNVKIEANDLPVMYQCELCEVCYSTQEEIKQHMEYVH